MFTHFLSLLIQTQFGYQTIFKRWTLEKDTG